MLRWYLIHTKPASEALAQTNLERQGYEVYLPRLAQNVSRRGKWRERIVALFPRYLFLRLSEGLQALGPVGSSVGVAGVVRFGTRYAIVDDRVIQDLRARGDRRSGLHRLKECAPLVNGARVRVASGPFDGLEGVFQRDAGEERVVILLRLLGRETAVRVASRLIQPAHP